MNAPTSDMFRPQNIEWQTRLQGVRLASFRSRAIALLIDGSIVVILLLVPRLWSQLAALGPPQSNSLSLEVGFGFLQYFTHPNRQTVHDRIAETIVIRVGKRDDR